jgi:hypothetical protein
LNAFYKKRFCVVLVLQSKKIFLSHVKNKLFKPPMNSSRFENHKSRILSFKRKNIKKFQGLNIRPMRRKYEMKLCREKTISCSFKFPVKVGVEESIVNAPLVSLQSKNTNKAKSEVRSVIRTT